MIRKNRYLIFAVLFFSVNDSRAFDKKDCETAFSDMIKGNGLNVWKKNLLDHNNKTNPKKVGDTYFSSDDASGQAISSFLSKNGCDQKIEHLKDHTSKGQGVCRSQCKNLIGYQYSSTHVKIFTSIIYYTIQNSDSPQNQRSKFFIFNMYPTLD